MAYNIPIDVCIICSKSMSCYSQFLSKKKGWSGTLCTPCADDIIAHYGSSGLGKLMDKNGLIDKIKEKLNTIPDQKSLQESIYKLVEEFVGSDIANKPLLDGIFDMVS